MFKFNKPSPFPDMVKMGVWGPPSSGKTTYMIMLQFADDKGEWKIRPIGEETQQIYLDGTDLMRDKKKFVTATPLETKYLTFDFEGPTKGITQKKRNFRVVIPEAPGEFYAYPDKAPELVGEMNRYQGIVWLIDPDFIKNPPQEEHRSYRRMIQEWLFKLYTKQGNTGNLQQHMAFCLTKMDLPEHYSHINDPKNYCLDLLGEDVQTFLEDFCDLNKIGFFATSSIGVNEKKQTVIDLSDPDRRTLRQTAHPINLFQPFLWLFNQLEK